MLIDAEWIDAREQATRPSAQGGQVAHREACVEGIDYPPRRELEKATVRQLATCRWVEEHQTSIITGATGAGKTYVACALAQQACRKGYSRHIPPGRLASSKSSTLARADGTYRACSRRLARVDVLVIDDSGCPRLRETERPRPPGDA